MMKEPRQEGRTIPRRKRKLQDCIGRLGNQQRGRQLGLVSLFPGSFVAFFFDIFLCLCSLTTSTVSAAAALPRYSPGVYNSAGGFAFRSYYYDSTAAVATVV